MIKKIFNFAISPFITGVILSIVFTELPIWKIVLLTIFFEFLIEFKIKNILSKQDKIS